MLLSFNTITQEQDSEQNKKFSQILTKIKQEISEISTQQATTAPPKSPKGKKGKRDDDQKQQEELEKKEAEDAHRLQERRQQIERILKEKEALKNLYLTIPNGIHLSFKHGLVVNDLEQMERNEKTFLVRQEQLRNEKDEVTLDNCNNVKEMYRCITSNGLIIKVIFTTTGLGSCP